MRVNETAVFVLLFTGSRLTIAAVSNFPSSRKLLAYNIYLLQGFDVEIRLATKDHSAGFHIASDNRNVDMPG